MSDVHLPSVTGAADSGGPVRQHLYRADAWSEVEPLWTRVFEVSEIRSFFTGPMWVGAWLRTYGHELNAEIAIYTSGDAPVAAAVLGAKQRALPLAPLSRLYFHTNGEPPADSPVAERSSLLARADAREEVLMMLGTLLRAREWDELVLNGVTETAFNDLTRVVTPDEADVEWRPTYLVDLVGLRRQNVAFEAVLSANTRSQINRSLRLYRERGEITLRQAQSIEDAHLLFDQLVEINRLRREGDRSRSVFSSERWLAFHRTLITQAFPTGAIQCVAVTAAGQTIGILYNFIDRGTISFYQSAFRYEPDNRLKPGHLTHALAIQAAIDAGYDVYDFLAADGPSGSRYKESMSMRTDRLAWAVLRRKTLPGIVVGTLRKARARLGGVTDTK